MMNSIRRLVRAGACIGAAACAVAGCSGGAGGGTTPPPASSQGYGGGNGILAIVARPLTGPVTHYYLVDLGTLGGNSSSANSINDRGWIGGLSKVSGNAALHADLWIEGQQVDLGTLGGPNSAIGWPVKNNRGEVAGFSDLAQTDPLDENFCGTGSPNLCAGFTWKDNVLTPLAPLGGNNSFAAAVNQWGRVAGFAETDRHDATCGKPQTYDYDAAIWERDGRPHALLPLRGDEVSQAVAINDDGAAVGASGPCGPPNNVGYGTAHATLWRHAHDPVALASLGGTTANFATAINDRDEIVGQSALSGNTTYHAVKWTRGSIRDLGTLPGDFLSEALGLNDHGETVGYSCDTGGTCRGFIWQNGGMTDLNLLVAPSEFDIVYAGDINDRGWIVGQAYDSKTGTAPAVLLIPASGAFTRPEFRPAASALPESVRRQFLQRRALRPFVR